GARAQRHRMGEGKEDGGGPDLEGVGVAAHRRGHDQWRGKKTVPVLMVLPEEAGIEAAGLGQAGLGNHLVDGAVEVFPPGRIGDGAVEAEFHRGAPLGERSRKPSVDRGGPPRRRTGEGGGSGYRLRSRFRSIFRSRWRSPPSLAASPLRRATSASRMPSSPSRASSSTSRAARSASTAFQARAS